jgi:hypothetical protein
MITVKELWALFCGIMKVCVVVTVTLVMLLRDFRLCGIIFMTRVFYFRFSRHYRRVIRQSIVTSGYRGEKQLKWWPSRSRDFTLPEFILWGFLKKGFHFNNTRNLEELNTLLQRLTQKHFAKQQHTEKGRSSRRREVFFSTCCETVV